MSTPMTVEPRPPSSSRPWIWLAIGCGVVLVLGGAALVAFFAWIVYGTTPQDIEVAVDSPTSVVVGESFKIVATLTNSAKKAQSLTDLDIAGSFLEGITVEAMEPVFKDSMGLPFGGGLSYTLDQEIEGGGELTLEIGLLGVREGDFGGDFDFCIDSEIKCITHHVRTLVTEADGGPAEADDGSDSL